jgi:hypothetical protein
MRLELILSLPIFVLLATYFAYYRSTFWEPTGRKRWRVKYESEIHILSVYEREWIHIRTGKIRWVETGGSDIKLKENNNDMES